MSDALCGPSNPLQQFKHESQLDRTLQQDRLTSRHSPAQSFRSHDPNSGLLDPEFEAFQAGVPTNDLPQFNPFQGPPGLAAPAQIPSWAADFQRMQISPPPAVAQQQQYASYAAPPAANWAQGFRQHIAQSAPRAQNSAASTPQAFQHMARYGVNSYQNRFAQPTFASDVQQSKGKEAVTEQFDEAAFERHFNQVQEALLAEGRLDEDIAMQEEEAPYATGASTGNFEEHESVDDKIERITREYTEEPDWRTNIWEMEQRNKITRLEMERSRREAENTLSSREAPNATGASTGNFQEPESLADLQEKLQILERENAARLRDARAEWLQSKNAGVHHLERNLDDVAVGTRSNDEELLREDMDSTMDTEPESTKEHKPQNDDDALALTAQELLDKVEHNQTDKFRNSQFLSLMRRLRDREVKVEGDKMVETAATASIAIDMGSTEMIARFDNSEQTPQPLQPMPQERVIDGTPNDATYHIPPQEQDHDPGRVDLRDGQEVVDLLNQKPDDTVSTPDIGTSAAPPALHPARDNVSTASGFPPGVFYGDLRQRGWSDVKTDGHGLDGALLQQPIDWKRWNLQSPGYRSHRSAQPAPGLH